MEPDCYSLTEEQIFNGIHPNPEMYEYEPEILRINLAAALECLCEKGCIKKSLDNDENYIYTCTDMQTDDKGLTQYQMTIWNYLKKRFYYKAIVLHCQFDKSNQTAKFIAEKTVELFKNPEPKTLPVTFLTLDNDKGILDQTVASLNKKMCDEFTITDGDYPALYKLYSNDYKTTVDSITGAIARFNQSYEYNVPTKEYPPIIVALCNPTQIAKIEQIYKRAIHDIVSQHQRCRLRANFIFDEVDKTYPVIISRLHKYLIDNHEGISTVLGVTGSEAGLTDKYPEWAKAELLNVIVDEEKQNNHRGIHSSDSRIHHVKQHSKESNTQYAMRVISENLPHFTNKRINPKNRSHYFAKVILLADQRVSSHYQIANELDKLGFHQILQNGNNLKYRRKGETAWTPVTTARKVLRNVLKQLFDEANLMDAPIVLIGNKKIDRGLGYHYAPPEGGPGVIWTDEIMGYISDEANGIQRVSRMHGVIAQCDDYPNEQHYWIDPRTDITVRNNAHIVTNLNKGYMGFIPLRMRLHYARSMSPKIKTPDPHNCVGETLVFEIYEEAKKFIETIKPNARPHEERYYLNEEGKYEASITNSDGAGRRPYTFKEYKEEDNELKPSSLLVPDDLKRYGVSCRLLPLYDDAEHTSVSWYVRYAIKNFECENGTVEEFLQQKVPYEIAIYTVDDIVKFVVSKKNIECEDTDVISYA